MKKLKNILKGIARGIWMLFMVSMISLTALAIKIHIENESPKIVQVPVDTKSENRFPELMDPYLGAWLESREELKRQNQKNQRLLSQNLFLWRERNIGWAKPELYQNVKVPLDSQIVLWETVKEFGKIVVERAEPSDTLIPALYEMLLNAKPIDRALADTLFPEHLTDRNIRIHFLGEGENLNPLSRNYNEGYKSWGGYAQYHSNLVVVKVYGGKDTPWIVSAVFHELMHHYLHEKFPNESKNITWQHSIIYPVQKRISEILNQKSFEEKTYYFDFSYIQSVEILGETKDGKRSFLSEIEKSNILKNFSNLENDVEGYKGGYWCVYFYSAGDQVGASKVKFKKDKKKIIFHFSFIDFDLLFDKDGFVTLEYDGENPDYAKSLEENKERIASLAFTDLQKELSLQAE